MGISYEDALRLVRDSIATADITGNPATFEPPVLRAVERAYARGVADGNRAGAGLYPEGG